MALNLRELTPGTKLQLKNGATVEVTSNPGDGVWVVARYLSSEDDPSQEGQEDMVCITDIRGLAS